MMKGGKQREVKAAPVKAATGAYGERILGRSNTTKSFQTYNYPEPEKVDLNPFSWRRKLPEPMVKEADSELISARKLVRSSSLRIQESNSIEKKMTKPGEEERKNGQFQNAEVIKELEIVKQELNNLKQKVASISEEKKRAEGEINSSRLNMKSRSSLAATLTKEISEINEEHVLVELAKTEAVKEYEEIKAQRKQKKARFLAAKDEIRRKKKKMIRKIENAKELRNKLVATISDVNMSENELKNMKKMHMNVRCQDSNSHEKHERTGLESSLESVRKDLEAANKELASVKEDEREFMTSIDTVNKELTRVAEDMSQLKKKVETSETIHQNLKSELLRAKAQLDAMSTAEEESSIVSNLSFAIEQLKSEAKTANRERLLIEEQTAVIKEENQKTENEIDLAEERLQTALQDLEAAKASEAAVLEDLEERLEGAMKSRASAVQPHSTITISRFEYDYLTGHASWAKEIADKKVAAAQAWTEAIQASEKEIVIKTKVLLREAKEPERKEELGLSETELKVNAWLHHPETAIQREAKNRSFRLTNAKKSSKVSKIVMSSWL